MGKDYGKIIYRKETGAYVVDKLCVPHPDDNSVPEEIRDAFAPQWADVHAYAEAHPEMVTEEGPCVPPVPTLDELKTAKKAQIDAETSAAITSGFDYVVDGVTYHFNYDTFGQQNFADTANVCLMKQSGMPGLPDSVTWNAYTPGGELERLTFDASGFLALYAGGAMKHKNETMQRGGERKAAVEAAATADVITAA